MIESKTIGSKRVTEQKYDGTRTRAKAHGPSGYPDCNDFVGVLRHYATAKSEAPAFSFLLDGRDDEVSLTYGGLDQKARAIAARLEEMGLTGERVLLAYPPGLDFIAGFFGCLYAGCVAVPTYPPHRHRMLDRFHRVVEDSGAPLALSNAAALAQFKLAVERGNGKAGGTKEIPWLATDEIPDEDAGRWSETAIAPDSLAMLQYTSGSTRQPKGVMLSHSNLVHNAQDIQRAFGMGGRELGVFWLPTYHDMGLMSAVLEPLLIGQPSILMSAASFLQQPFLWLSAISRRRATISGGPNFAYDLCVRKVTDEQKATLDLSSWSLAFIGAEPVVPATLERFAEVFGPCGFDPKAFYPCYGLAESTLMVTGGKRGGGLTVRLFDAAAMTEHRVASANGDGKPSRTQTACGSPIGDSRVVIANPQSLAQCSPSQIGEVWVAGPSVGQGYWKNTNQSRYSFDAFLSDTGEGPFLRTGDLGFVSDGQLYITGRIDDLLIIRGLNHYPQDIEATARESHPWLATGAGAAFAVENGGAPRLALVHEVNCNGEKDFAPVIEAVRSAVLDEHGIGLDSVVLLRSGMLPKTSSGKVQRHACRTAMLDGEFKSLAEYHGQTPGNGDGHELPTPPVPKVAVRDASEALALIYQHARAITGNAMPDLSPTTPLTSLGLDSLQRLELVAMLEKTSTGFLSNTMVSQATTVGELAQVVQEHLNGAVKSRGASPGGAAEVPVEHYDVARFPEYTELKRQQSLLAAVAGANPYFRVDDGGAASLGTACIEGRERINYCVYDYIGMAHEPRIAAAIADSVNRYGASAGASRLVFGEKRIHRELEKALSDFLGVPDAIALVSGHSTNVTTIGHLLGHNDLVVHDVLAHNSVLQGAKLSGATARAFAHNNWQSLDVLLAEARHKYRRVLIAIEGVYSMDGDWPDLPRFIELKKKHRAMLLVDEAHSLGTMGATGRGIGEYFGVTRSDVDLWMGTLSKSLASCGGYIAGSAELIEYLKYTAPGFVYSVGLSPPNSASALTALKILREEPQRVTRLHKIGALFLKLAKDRGLNTGSAAGTSVVPVVVGNSVKCLRLARALFEHGIHAQPILYPAVPEHAARLRFFITTNHTEEHVQTTVNVLAEQLAKL